MRQVILNDCQIGSGKIEHLVNLGKPGIIPKKRTLASFCCITFPWISIEFSQRSGYLPLDWKCTLTVNIMRRLVLASQGFDLQGSVGSRHLSASFETSARRNARQIELDLHTSRRDLALMRPFLAQSVHSIQIKRNSNRKTREPPWIQKVSGGPDTKNLIDNIQRTGGSLNGLRKPWFPSSIRR